MHQIDTSLEILATLESHVADLHAGASASEPDEHRAIAECQCRVARDYRVATQWRRALRKGERFVLDTTLTNQLSALEVETQGLRHEALIEVDDRGLVGASEQYYLLALAALDQAQRYFVLARLGAKA
jgi:hypothetical protein